MSISDRRGDDDWLRRWWWPWSSWEEMTKLIAGGGVFKKFEDMRSNMERVLEETTRDVANLPNELIREYSTPTGKVREVGPLVYGYSVIIDSNGKPKVRVFGNVRSSLDHEGIVQPMLVTEREPLTDILITDKEIKLTVEMPGISKGDIQINVYDSTLEISTTETAPKKYRSILDLPPQVDIETAKSKYNNGLLEIVFGKKTKQKGRDIKVN
jgi:HSP20 family protein